MEQNHKRHAISRRNLTGYLSTASTVLALIILPAKPVQAITLQSTATAVPSPAFKAVQPEDLPHVKMIQVAANDHKKSGGKKRRNTQRIEVLVNDQPITGYEIDQRAGLLSLRAEGVGKRIQARAKARWKQVIKDPSINKRFEALLRKKNVQTREEAKKLQISFIKNMQRNMVDRIRREERAKVRKNARGKAIKELIDEKLKLQEARRLNLVAGDEEVDKALTGLAEKNKMDLTQFGTHLNKMGTGLSTMRARYKSLISWQGVVRRRFGFQVAMMTRDVDRYMEQSAGDDDSVELKVHRISIPLPSDAGQSVMAQRLQLADAARRSYRGCDSTAAVAEGLPAAKFENLGTLKSSTVSEPTRSMLLAASDGDMLPPSLDGDGIQLWAVCGRNTVALETKKRVKEQGTIRQEEFGILAQKHLKDLRQDAIIDYR